MTTINFTTLIDQENFQHYYQPIYNLSDKRWIGFEALFRSEVSTNPELVFRAARERSRLYELEIKSIRKAISSFVEARSNTECRKLFVNAFPSTISTSSFFPSIDRIVSENNLNSGQVVFEINEAELISDFLRFKKDLLELKARGFSIAIDDVGKGAASLKAIVELEPDFIKMDNYFSVDLASSEQKQELIKSFLTYCINTNTQFVLEGIEDPRDLKAAKALGVPYGQGYLLGEPAPLKTLASV